MYNTLSVDCIVHCLDPATFCFLKNFVTTTFLLRTLVVELRRLDFCYTSLHVVRKVVQQKSESLVKTCCRRFVVGCMHDVWLSCGLGHGSNVFTLRWVALGWVKEIGPTDNSTVT